MARLHRRGVGWIALVALGAAVPLAAPATPELNLRFVARWGGHTKDLGYAVAADATHVFVTGATWSGDFPVTTGRPPDGQSWCAFLTQLQSLSGALVRSSVLCSRGMTYGRSAAVDGGGAVWVGGSSNGPGLTVASDAAQPQYGGGSSGGTGDAFIGRWTPSGDLDYLTYLGGAGDEVAWGIASDRSGGVWIAGSTTSRPLLRGSSAATGTATIASADGFVAHVAGDRRLDAVKIIGGEGVDELYDVALIDPQRLVVVGATASSEGGLGATHGALDGLVALIDTATLQVLWTLRLGGPRNDVLRAVAVVDGNAIVAVGWTDGGACRPSRGGADGWIVTVSRAGSVVRSDCVGTGASDSLADVVAVASGAVWMTGTTDAASSLGAVRGKAYDRAFSLLNRPVGVGSLRLLSNEISRGYGIAADADGNVYMVGETTAVPSRTGGWTAALHATAGAYRGTHPPGSTDPYVVALRLKTPDSPVLIGTSPPIRGLRRD